MLSLKRFSLMLAAIVFVALFIGPQPARADNVVITSGSLGLGQVQNVNFGLVGDGLSFSGHGTSSARFCSNCPGGSIVNASMPFVFENSGGATINGVRRTVFYTGSIFFTSGPLAIPLNDPTLPLDVTAAFTMSGSVNMYLGDPSLGDPGPPVFSSTLSGQGIVTLRMTSAIGVDGQRHYDQRAVIYNFQPEPVPEPATLLLLGSGLTGLVMKARRKRSGAADRDE